MKKDRRSEKEIENIERARHDEALLAEEEVNIEEVMAEYDRESNTRHFTSWRGVAIKAMLIAFSSANARDTTAYRRKRLTRSCCGKRKKANAWCG